MSEKKNKSLNVMKGVNQPSSLNKNFKYKKNRLNELSADELFEGIRQGRLDILSKAITITESVKSEHQQVAQDLIEKCLPYSGNSIRIGISGVPGVGKSSFIESFGNLLIKEGNRIAVLAIDPSSKSNKGSILGDKTRMENLSKSRDAFIRPTATSGSLGGVARTTRESIVLCEAAGFNLIIIETVGVGQSETQVHGMVDFFLLLMLAGAGDELQGIKRGIMEMCDALVINKADGDNIQKAERAKIDYKNALHIFPPKESNWETRVHTCSSIENRGIQDIWESIKAHNKHTKENGFFEQHRKKQELERFEDYLKEALSRHFYSNAVIKEKITDIKANILGGKISIYNAVNKLIEEYLSKISK
jgi:LAO/AO transport system kinase